MRDDEAVRRRVALLARHLYLAADVAVGTIASVVLAIGVSAGRAVRRRLRRP